MNSLYIYDGRFHLICAGSRPLIAYPIASVNINLAAIRCYPNYTLKRKIVRSILRIVALSRMNYWLWHTVKEPIAELESAGLEIWLTKLCLLFNDRKLYPVIVWPANSERGRVYIHMLNEIGEPIAFVKLALDQINSELIRNEKITLQRLATMRLKNIIIPKVLGSGKVEDYSYIVSEYIPAQAEEIEWSRENELKKIVNEYAGEIRNIQINEAKLLPWWKILSTKIGQDSKLYESIKKAATLGIDVCRIHGDFNKTNILKVEESILLLDWERSCESGPYLTDIICTEVELLWPISLRNITLALNKFTAKHWENRDYKYRCDVLLALAYLYSVNFTPASLLFVRFNNIQF